MPGSPALRYAPRSAAFPRAFGVPAPPGVSLPNYLTELLSRSLTSLCTIGHPPATSAVVLAEGATCASTRNALRLLTTPVIRVPRVQAEEMLTVSLAQVSPSLSVLPRLGEDQTVQGPPDGGRESSHLLANPLRVRGVPRSMHRLHEWLLFLSMVSVAGSTSLGGRPFGRTPGSATPGSVHTAVESGVEVAGAFDPRRGVAAASGGTPL